MSQPSSDYPHFPDADVLIVSMSGKTWKLHSRILANGSVELGKKLAGTPPAKLRREDKAEGNLIQWKLQMHKHPAAIYVDPHGICYVDFMAVVCGLCAFTKSVMSILRTARHHILTMMTGSEKNATHRIQPPQHSWCPNEIR